MPRLYVPILFNIRTFCRLLPLAWLPLASDGERIPRCFAQTSSLSQRQQRTSLPQPPSSHVGKRIAWQIQKAVYPPTASTPRHSTPSLHDPFWLRVSPDVTGSSSGPRSHQHSALGRHCTSCRGSRCSGYVEGIGISRLRGSGRRLGRFYSWMGLRGRTS